jgi:RNA polymerase primary sigma factor
VTPRFEDHTGLIGLVLKRHRYLHVCGSLEREDLWQAGAIGLLRAIELFDPSRGVAFPTYAIPWIRQAVGRLIANHASSVRLPVHLQRARWRQGCSVRARVASLDAPLASVEDGTLHDVLPAPEHDPAARADAEALLAGLTEKERRVLRLRFFGGERLVDVGGELGVTRERARQIEQGALARLRQGARRQRPVSGARF